MVDGAYRWNKIDGMLSRLKNIDWLVPIAVLGLLVMVGISLYWLNAFFVAMLTRLVIANDSPVAVEMRYLHDDGDNSNNKSYTSWRQIQPTGEFSDLFYGGLYCLEVRTATTTASYEFDVLAPQPVIHEEQTQAQAWLFGSPGRRVWAYRLSDFREPCRIDIGTRRAADAQ